MRPDKFDRSGRPLDLHEWGRLLQDPVYKRVAADDVGPVWVSTVWLGLDHQFGHGPPLIFETMLFARGDRVPNRTEWSDLWTWRCPTEALALRGHALIVAKLTDILLIANLTPDDVRKLLADVTPNEGHDA